jgi:hypothetical protein
MSVAIGIAHSRDSIPPPFVRKKRSRDDRHLRHAANANELSSLLSLRGAKTALPEPTRANPLDRASRE